MEVHPDREVQVVALIADEASVAILAEYSDFEDVFSKESAVVLLEHTEINTHTIDLEEGKQPPYGPIYSLRPVELKTLKTYIETNLANWLYSFFKSPRWCSDLVWQEARWKSSSLCWLSGPQ